MPNPLFLKPIDNIIQKERIVLAAGRIDGWHVKGFDVLIKSWKKIQDLNDSVNNDDNLRDWWLKIAGTGKKESFEYLTNLLPDGGWVFNDNDNDDDNDNNDDNNDDNLKDWGWKSEKYHIEFLGFQKDIESLYKKSEIFVLSSRYEGFGLVLIEAMSQGCACVACDYKGRQKEILCPDGQVFHVQSLNSRMEICENGILCEPDNIESLTQGLAKMIEDDKYRKQVQLKAIERSRYYDMEHTMDRWEEFLQKICS